VGGETGAAEWAQELAKQTSEVEGWVCLPVIEVLERSKTEMGLLCARTKGKWADILFSWYARIRRYWDAEYDDLIANQNLMTQKRLTVSEK
jgi:hypothetical protein